MKLYESPSPNARRVHIFMAEKGLDFDRVAVDIRAGDNLSPEFLLKNPGGRVPVLELDNGTFLSESVAICRYIEGLQPEPNLFGNTPLESATIEMWNRRAEMGLFLEIGMAFRNLTGFFKDRETCVPEWGKISAAKAAKNLDWFDDQLAKNTYIAGDRFSIADITTAVALDFAAMVKVVELPDHTNVARWKAEIDKRPSMRAK